MGATGMAKSFAQTQNWGTWTQSFAAPTGHDGSDFHVGDIFSLNGHVWICLGTCSDGSIVFMHSTPSGSKTGQPGGGVQISALNPKNTGKNCEAYDLANRYMKVYYPLWSQRYDAVLKDYSDYTSFTGSSAGKFTWSLDGTGALTDPDGYANKTPAQILSELFHDAGPIGSNYTARGVYLGVKDYGTVTKNDKPNFQHQFYVNGEIKTHTISTDEAKGYAIQNTLQEGYLYDLTVVNDSVTAATLQNGDLYGAVTEVGSDYIRLDKEKFFLTSDTKSYEITTAAGGASVSKNHTIQTGDTVRIFVDEDDNILEMYKTFVAADYTPAVSGIPGRATLKNFLATALEPVGTGLYIYGGTWDWQDNASSNQATTIGLPQSWIDFFQSHDANYTYKVMDGEGKSTDYAHSYYPNGEWNQYYYAGIDCSAYVAWATYNTLNTTSGGNGYVMSSTKMAKNFAQTQNWGTWTQSFTTPTSHTGSDFHVGDIFSINGHVWICLGTCDDGSIVIMHSTPSDSKNGQPGGGVQISALNPAAPDSKDCEAYRLASKYMTDYYPEWSTRYDAVLKSYSGYTTFTGTSAGKFTWSLDGSGALTDPDGYAGMTPAQILADLFHQEGDAVYLGIENYGDRNTNYNHKSTLQHKFFMDGAVRTFTVDDSNDYAIQNTLQEGYVYRLTVNGNEVKSAEMLDKGHADVVMGTVSALSNAGITVSGTTLAMDASTKTYRITAQAGGSTVTPATAAVGVTAKIVKDGGTAKEIYLVPVAAPYTSPVNGTPGTKTLKNFLATALEPVGTGLYIYGGTWDWQDVGSSNQATTIGIPQSWIDFFQTQNVNFTYKNLTDHAHSYYPFEEWNQYYFAGVDCSGYVAWVLYNTMNTTSGGNGYVMGATGMAKSFAQTQNWGTWTQSFAAPTGHDGSDFHVGDIFSLNGHVWICLGTCSDGSIVFMHSTPSGSKTGQPGGGVQISALNPKNTGKNCEAYDLANRYMKVYYPLWSQRYDAVLKDYSDYTSFTGSSAGKFTWSLDGTGALTDPDGYANKTPAQILELLLGKAVISTGGNGGGSTTTTRPTAGTAPTITAPSNGVVTDSSITSVVTTAGKGGDINISASSSVAATLSGTAAGKAAENGSTLNITVQSGGVISLTPAVVQGLNLKASDKVSVGITAVAGSAASAPTFEVNLTVNGTPVHELGGAITMTFPVNTTWNGKEVVVKHDHADGSVTYGRATVKNGKASAAATDLSAFTVCLATDLPAAAFTDLKVEDWSFGGIEYAVEKGLFNGTSAATFAPGSPMTRQQMWMVLARLSGQTPAAMADAKNWAVTGGISDGSNPTAPVTRQQFVALLWRAVGSPKANKNLSAYSDAASVAVYARDAFAWAAENGVVSGTSATTLSPNGTATRAQIAVMLSRYGQKAR